MTGIRIRDYQSPDAENLNRIAVSAFAQFRDRYQDWPAMLAGLSKTSDLSAAGEIIVVEFQNQMAGASPISARVPKRLRSSTKTGR